MWLPFWVWLTFLTKVFPPNLVLLGFVLNFYTNIKHYNYQNIKWTYIIDLYIWLLISLWIDRVNVWQWVFSNSVYVNLTLVMTLFDACICISSQCFIRVHCAKILVEGLCRIGVSCAFDWRERWVTLTLKLTVSWIFSSMCQAHLFLNIALLSSIAFLCSTILIGARWAPVIWHSSWRPLILIALAINV